MTSPSGGSAQIPDSIKVFDQAVHGVEGLIERIRAEFSKLIDRVDAFVRNVQRELEDSWLDSVVEWFTDDVGEALAEVRRLLAQAKRELEQLLGKAESSVAGSIPVASLFTHAFELAAVNRTLTGMYGEMTGSGEIDFWRGPAKLTYDKRVADQQEALGNTSEKVQSLATFLGDAAAANTTYMAELGARMGEIYGVLTTTCIDVVEAGAGAVTQVVIGLGHFSELIGAVVSEVIGYIAALGARIAEVLNQILALEAANSDLRGLTADGAWPAPVST